MWKKKSTATFPWAVMVPSLLPYLSYKSCYCGVTIFLMIAWKYTLPPSITKTTTVLKTTTTSTKQPLLLQIGELPDLTQRIVAFGGAANMVHPSTGYHACRMLAASSDLSAVIGQGVRGAYPPDKIAAEAYKVLVPQ